MPLNLITHPFTFKVQFAPLHAIVLLFKMGYCINVPTIGKRRFQAM